MAQAKAELLVELLIEQMPAAAQQPLSEALQAKLLAALREAEIDIMAEDAKNYYTPRRLVVSVKNLPTHTSERNIERKGPRTTAPQQAIQGFLKANGIALEDCTVKPTPTPREPGVESYFYVKTLPPTPLAKLLSEWVNQAIAGLPHQKAMRFAENSTFRFIRPLRRIMIYFDGKPLEGRLESGGIRIDYSADTVGHHVQGEPVFAADNLKDYLTKAKQHGVIIDPQERVKIINDTLAPLIPGDFAFTLMNEVANLCEYPVMLEGRFDEKFLQTLPQFVTESVLACHQKHFALYSLSTFKLESRFAFAADGDRSKQDNQQIIIGNQRVLTARLEDAAFFITQDLKQPVEERIAALERLVFHQKLGSMADRMRHIGTLAEFLCEYTKADAKQAARAAQLLKSDLPSLMVQEFTELQGKIGRYYADKTDESHEVTHAIAEHYFPQHDGDPAPAVPLSVTMALADRLITLTGFFAAKMRPTGSKDPFALRRAALGIARIIRANDTLHLPLRPLISHAFDCWELNPQDKGKICEEILCFIIDRQIDFMKRNNLRYDCIQAILARRSDDGLLPDDLIALTDDADALREFLDGEEGDNLLTASRRVSHLIASEEKKRKSDLPFTDKPDSKRFEQEEETKLFEALETLDFTPDNITGEKFTQALKQLAKLRSLVDKFFDEVTVISDDAKLAENRMRLLLYFRHLASALADFDQIRE